MIQSENQQLASGQHPNKHVTSISCTLEPTIRPRATGQRIPCFDSCQLIVAWMSNIEEVHGKTKVFKMSLSTSFLEYGHHVARLRRRRFRRRRCTYAPTSSTANHDDHDGRKSTHRFSFLSNDDYWAPLGVRGFAKRSTPGEQKLCTFSSFKIWRL